MQVPALSYFLIVFCPFKEIFHVLSNVKSLSVDAFTLKCLKYYCVVRS